MENNDKLIADLRNLEAIAYGYNLNGEVLGMDCSDFEQLMVDAADALANAQTTIASDQRIIQSLRQSCDAFSRRNMELVAENKDLKAKELHGWWRGYTRSRFCGMDDLSEPIWRDGVVYYCSECSRKTVIKENYCPMCGAKMDEEDEK